MENKVTRHRFTDKDLETIKILGAHKLDRANIAQIVGCSKDSVNRVLNGTYESRLEYMRNYKTAKRKSEEKKNEQIVEQLEIANDAQTKAISDEALYSVMKNAMRDAVSAALEDYTRRLRGVIQVAVQDAMKAPAQ